MGEKPTLYELLGVTAQAGVPQIQAAFQKKMALLESARGTMDLQEFNETVQLLRVAMDTLTDSTARFSYDAKLRALRQDPTPGALVHAGPAPVSSAQADALALRADAMALRADALMIRAGLGTPGEGSGAAMQAMATGAATVLKRVVSLIGLLAIVGIGFFLVARHGQGDSPVRKTPREATAQEQVILQEYYQTHGVRPASLAEMELLQADQRRRDNEDKLGKQDRDKQEREARLFEEESRRIAERASADLRHAEELAKREAERQMERQRYEDLRKIETERQKAEAEQRRIERQEAQWRAVLQR